MTIEEILAIVASDPKTAIKYLKGTIVPINVVDIRKELDPMLHKCMDKSEKPDRQLLGESGQLRGIDKVGRTPLAFQELIVARAVSFLFGFDPKIKAETSDPTSIELLNSVKKVLNIAKSNTLNADIATDLFSCKQVAELWYPVETKESKDYYGFESKTKLRTMIFSPLRGDNLYPFYDIFGDLVAFSREYTVTTLDGDFKYFETYTAENIIKFDVSKEVVMLTNDKNTIGKIPVVFAEQPTVEWYKVQKNIERLEDLLSRFSDTNDKNGAPILFINGALQEMPSKESTGKLLVGEPGSTAQYITWSQAPESIKLEIETLIDFIYSFTQTPNISFESVKGIGQVSGIALKLLFIDAHMKVQTKRRIFDNYLIRRINIIKAYLSVLNKSFAKVENLFIEAEIVPYIINDEKLMIENLLTANGGQAILSQKTAISQSGLVDDTEAELLLIQGEAQSAATLNVLQPAI